MKTETLAARTLEATNRIAEIAAGLAERHNVDRGLVEALGATHRDPAITTLLRAEALVRFLEALDAALEAGRAGKGKGKGGNA